MDVEMWVTVGHLKYLRTGATSICYQDSILGIMTGSS